MGWAGKLLGGAFGFLIGGPLGALIGATFGHNFDRGMSQVERLPGGEERGWGRGDQQRVQSVFFSATFAVMGHIAKVDGHVSREEIRLAEAVMDQLQLDSTLRQVARKLFNEGKQPDFALDEVLRQLRRELGRRTNLVRLFLEIQLQAVYADGAVHAAERQVLLRIVELLQIGSAEFEQLERMVRAATGQRAEQGGAMDLAAAYQILGVDRDSSDAEVKRSYRRLIGQHHPDKLVSKGLPEEMMKVAADKTHQIRTAYETIRRSRKG